MCAVLQTADRDSQRGASGNPNMELKELSYSNCNRTTILLRPYDKSAPAPCPNDSEGSIDHNNARNTSSSSGVAVVTAMDHLGLPTRLYDKKETYFWLTALLLVLLKERVIIQRFD